MPALVKVALLVVSGILNKIASTPPQPNRERDDRSTSISRQIRPPNTFFEKYVSSRHLGYQVGFAIPLTLEIFLIIDDYFNLEETIPLPFSPSDFVCPNKENVKELSDLSYLFLLGNAGIILGGLIRVWCYRTLGRHFTFRLKIHKNHQLIRSGPYAIVRHPSYTAMALVITGTFIILLGSNQYLRVCGITTNVFARLFISVWATFTLFGLFSLLMRGKAEDKSLREEFGKRWDDYAKVVPCRFLPGVI